MLTLFDGFGLSQHPMSLLHHMHRHQPVTSFRRSVTSSVRMALLPDVPTMAEAGSPYEASSWFGLAAPARPPPEIIARLNRDAVAGLRTPATQQRFAPSGARLVGDTPEEFQAFIASERARWGAMIRAAGIKID